MRKFLVLALVCAFVSVSSSAFAGKLRDNVGCGVGTLVFENIGKPNGGWLLQALASYTNGSLSQSLSMTFGTVGCRGNINHVVGLEKAYEFVSANMDNLAKDAAMGSGETITSLAALLEVSDVVAFGANIQEHFAEIFPHADVQSAEVLVKIVEINS